MKNENYDILWKNEIEANKVTTIALIVSAFVALSFWVLYEFNVFTLKLAVARWALIMSIVVLFIVSAVSVKFKFSEKWLKYMMMSALILVYAVIDVIFTYNVVLLLVVPMVLSSRYFSKRYTIQIVVGTMIVFFISAILGANNGLMDLNNFEQPIGTVLVVGNEGIQPHSIVPWEYDHTLMIINSLRYSFAIKALLSVIVALSCVRVSEQGKSLVFKQQELSEHAAMVDAELSLATRIQADTLPGDFPAFPGRSEFDLYASMTPAKEVGGDFYDFFMVDDDHLGLVIADVSDKGIPAAMFMMVTKNIIANNAMMGKAPAKALEDANVAICKNNSEDLFLTAWLGVLEISTGILRCANAGHEYPIIKRGDGPFELYEDPHGMLMGWEDDNEYEEYEIKLSAGDRVFVYTDGVPEATAAGEKMFGTDRTVEVLNANPGASPQEMLEAVHRSVNEFVGEAEQFDDLTMLALEYRKKE